LAAALVVIVAAVVASAPASAADSSSRRVDSPQRLRAQTGPSLSGTVRDAATGAGLNGVCVRMISTQSGGPFFWTSVNGDGTWSVTVPDGSYYLAFYAPTGGDCSGGMPLATNPVPAWWQNVALTPGPPDTLTPPPPATAVTTGGPPVDACLGATSLPTSCTTPDGTLSGSVVTTGLQPVAGACVFVLGHTGPLGEAIAAPDGTWSVTGLPVNLDMALAAFAALGPPTDPCNADNGPPPPPGPGQLQPVAWPNAWVDLSNPALGQDPYAALIAGGAQPLQASLSDLELCLSSVPGTVVPRPSCADPGPAQLTVTEPGNATAGHPLSDQPVVTIEDASGNPVTSDNSPITLSTTAGTGTPGAVLSCAANPVAAVGGVASFAGCSIDRPGIGYTLTANDTTDGLSVVSAPFNVGGAGRIFGPDAITTAVAISQAEFPARASAHAVVLARSDFFADALAGGPLAAKVSGPLLITPGPDIMPPFGLDARVLAEIQRVLVSGGPVYVVGGPEALSPAIDAQLATLGYHPTRVQGPNEYATAVAIAHQLGDPTTIFEATGLDFPDALSAVPAAIDTHGAILLTNGTSQAPETAADLAAHPPTTKYAIGGPLAAAGADPTAKPVYGADLFGTSAAVANMFFPHASVFGAATGLNYPDALAGGVYMATSQRLGPVLLVNTNAPLPVPIAAYLSSLALGTQGYVFGGPLAVGNDVISTLDAAIG